MTKANSIQNGKGSKPRKGANYRAYWESELWEKMGKKSTTLSHSISTHSSLVAQKER